MNIFKILSSYDGSINEPNISSFLSYFLSVNEDHGLSGLLLAEILNDFISTDRNYFKQIQNNAKIEDLTRYDIKINPELSVVTKSDKRRKVDIVVEIYTCKSEAPLNSICIENKIHNY